MSLEHWNDLLERLEPGMRDEVRAAMTAPDRHYHDARHIGAIWQMHLETGGDPGDQAVLWAAAYHDLILLPGAPRGENEEASARAFERTASRLRLDPALTARAARMIRATGDHLAAEGEDETRFCDLDLAGMASDWECFCENTRRLRREHPAASDAEFRDGRRRFLIGLDRAPRLFRSPRTPASWEPAARANIARDIRLLGARP
ncbi:hypothetical protein M0638_04975 [Roseomonas sp. NAR14]|uniref:HD domain-containing protein n=1 Tax=Roseomonas acroporae TaxID=2937791 RepID=A0A9X2BWC5_9PROT|nr:hypothetical protein [Roseomonas acroporae]MCK8783735.1 hypothetical protein [Roseomonas acroporae]